MEIQKELANLFLLSMSNLHLSSKLICCTAPSSVSVPHGSEMTYGGLFWGWVTGAASVLLKDRGLTGPGQVPCVCRAEAALPPHAAHPSGCPSKTTTLAAFDSLTHAHITLPGWCLRCRGQKYTQKSCLVVFKPTCPVWSLNTQWILVSNVIYWFSLIY